MITKRARRWLRRGITIAVMLIVMVLGAATWVYSGTIEEELLKVAGTAEQADPSDVGVEFANVTVAGPLGAYPAWRTAGTDDTWIVFVHGSEGTRDDALHLVPVIEDLGFPGLVVTYRNDARAPASETRHHAMGDDEWEDLEAAALYAFEEGAHDLVLVGFGSGASAAIRLLTESDWASRVNGLIFDSPLLDPGSAVDHRAEPRNVPGFLAGWSRALATLRFGVDWASLNHVARAEEVTVPVVLFHGDADVVIPVASSDAFAEALSDQVRYLRFPGVGHLGSFAAAPVRYTGAVTGFLEEVALGPSDLGPVDLDLLELEE